MQVSIFQRNKGARLVQKHQYHMQTNQIQLQLPTSQLLKIKDSQSIASLKRKRQLLPQIQSPFLRKTVYNLFPHKQSHSRRQSNQIKSEQYKIHPNNSPSTKMPFEFSSQNISSRYIYEDKMEINKKQRIKIETGFESTSLTKKFNQLHLNQKINVMRRKKEGGIMSKQFAKSEQSHRQQKSPNYVAKHKMTESLYRQQKHQIKLIREYVSSKHSNSVGKGLNIKTYTKFFPTIMTIEN